MSLTTDRGRNNRGTPPLSPGHVIHKVVSGLTAQFQAAGGR